MSAYQSLAVVFILMLLGYFFEVFGFIRSIRGGNVWDHIGAPDISSPNGQTRLFSLIFGRNRKAFEMLPPKLRAKCRRIRFYTVVGMASFAALAFVLLSRGQPA